MVRLIGHADRTLSESVPADPDVVREYCVDLRHLPDVHPDGPIRTVSRRATTDDDELVYRVQDGVPLGFVTLPLVYTVRLRVPIAGSVSAETHPVPLVRLDSVIAFEPIPAGTRLKEYLRISAPRPVLTLVAGRVFAAHAELLVAVRRHFTP